MPQSARFGLHLRHYIRSLPAPSPAPNVSALHALALPLHPSFRPCAQDHTIRTTIRAPCKRSRSRHDLPYPSTSDVLASRQRTARLAFPIAPSPQTVTTELCGGSASKYEMLYRSQRAAFGRTAKPSAIGSCRVFSPLPRHATHPGREDSTALCVLVRLQRAACTPGPTRCCRSWVVSSSTITWHVKPPVSGIATDR